MAITNASNAWQVNGDQYSGSVANTDKPYVSSNRPGSNATGQLIQSTSLLDQRDIYKQLVDLQDDAEWLDFMWMAGKKEATSVPTYFSFFNDKLYKPITITTGASITAGDGNTGTLVTDEDSYAFVVVGDLIRVKTSAGTAVVRVKTKQIVSGAYQLTVTSVTNSALTITSATVGSAFSNAQVEGSSAPTARRWLVGKLGNQTQIFRNTLVITDVQNMSKVELEFNGKPYILPYEMIQGLQKHRGDISLAMWLGEASVNTFAGAAGSSYSDLSGSYNYQTTRGMDSYVETYGISGQTTGYATGAFTLPDLTAIEAQLIANRAPFEYMMAGSTAAVATISDFLKNLPSSGVVPAAGSQANGLYSGRLNVDGREVDLEVEKFKHAGFTFNLKAFKVLSNNEVMAYTGSTVQKSIYFLPMGKVKTVGGGMVDYFRYRYLPQPTPGQGSSETAEIMTGGLAPTPTNQEMNLTTTWTSNMGLEVFAPNKFAKIQVNA